MDINTNSWHYRFLFSDDWWERNPERYRTLCGYNWALLGLILTTAIIAFIVFMLGVGFGTITVAAPIFFIYEGLLGYGWNLSAGLIAGSIIDAVVVAFVVAAHKSDALEELVDRIDERYQSKVNALVDTWAWQTVKGFKEKHCKILNFVEPK